MNNDTINTIDNAVPSRLAQPVRDLLTRALNQLKQFHWPMTVVLAGGWRHKEIAYTPEHILSDIDMFIFSNWLPWFWHQLTRQGQQLAASEQSVQFDYRGGLPWLLHRSQTFWAYKLKHEGIILRGNPRLLQRIRALSFGMDVIESTRILFHSLLLWLYPLSRNNSSSPYLISRPYLYIGEAYLSFGKRLAPTYAERRDNFAQLADEWSLPADLRERVLAAYAIKTGQFDLYPSVRFVWATALEDTKRVIDDILRRWSGHDTTVVTWTALDQITAVDYLFNGIFWARLRYGTKTLKPKLSVLVQFKIVDLYYAAWYHMRGELTQRDKILRRYFSYHQWDEDTFTQLLRLWPVPVLVSIKKCRERPPAVVTITVDGGYAETVHHFLTQPGAMPLPLTWFLVTDSIGRHLSERPVADWAVWRQAHDYRWEVGGHTHTHPLLQLNQREQSRHWTELLLSAAKRFWRQPIKWLRLGRFITANLEINRKAVPADAFIAEAALSKRILEEKLGQSVASFAYPGGHASQTIAKNLHQLGYLSARTTSPGINRWLTLNPYALKSMVWTKTTTLAEANRWADQVHRQGGWLIETLHLVTDNRSRTHSYAFATKGELIDQHLDYIRQLGIPIITQSDAMEEKI
ncbi:hypothetical protein A3K24_01490 [candidate division Kazan bacterium RIFCSPHIGHO2_01_FULL_44_14]|uniref:NodB homology domain-containing protein n=1 Tax=candidate division Kazan bacterium RIFCSPLOWO2_01_FULL_45_19 TaxID=1798538 RepID=A0A1F4NPY5_UNCK3|nr:MAG: hypothetical protein A3K51_01490 [candidate division Kazan bacterium RIFCSPLOWO2_01_FULL_45_19]OGB77754.1 MAG: hypothetical protein A3K24_01490 [candidate division Kazan bacterium RIFCSPHIGHO2_01_FULL_44_14]